LQEQKGATLPVALATFACAKAQEAAPQREEGVLRRVLRRVLPFALATFACAKAQEAALPFALAKARGSKEDSAEGEQQGEQKEEQGATALLK
jgi:hypothetical protein